MIAFRLANRLFGATAHRSTPDPAAAVEAGPPLAKESAALAGFARLPALIGLALVMALLLLRLPYRGIRHDSLLYTAQALTHLDPTWATNDVYFKFGSQDQFSLFSTALAALIGHFGMPTTELVLLLAGHLALLAAIWWLASDLSPAGRWLGLVTVVGVPSFFGPGNIFALIEPFLTARTAAMPLSILALAALVRGRTAIAFVALVLGGLMHPLVAIPAAVVGWCYLVAGNRRWLWLGAAIVPVVALAWAGIAPFDRLRHTYDDVWMQGVMSANADVFLNTWDVYDASRVLMTVVLLWLATRGNTTPLARLARCSIVATAVLAVVSFVGADVFQNVLISQLQLWRALWVVHLLFVLWLPSLMLDEWKHGALGRLGAVTLLFVVPGMLAFVPNIWIATFWALLLLVLRRRGVVLSPSVYRLVLGLTVVAGVILCGLTAWKLFYEGRMHFTGVASTSVWSLPFTISALVIPVGALWLATASRPGLVGRIAAGAAVLALVGAAWQFDQRTPFSRYVESSSGSGHPFQAIIPRGAQVYWEDMDVEPVWFMLRRPSFLGAAQFSGLLFNRDTSRVAMGRWPLLGPIASQMSGCSKLEGLVAGGYRYEDCELAEDKFLDLCRAPDHADFLVSHLNYKHPSVAQWRFDPQDGSPAVTYYLHDCKSVH